MQTFDITVPVGGAFEINVPGRYVYFLNGSAGGADTTITVRSGNGGDTFLLKPGQAVRLGNAEITRWIIGNKLGQATIVGTLLIGDGEFSDNRISGSVEVIDGGRNRTKADTAFIGWFALTALAANYSHVSINNPVGSGKNIVLEQIILASASNTGYELRLGAGEIGTLQGLGESKQFKGLIQSSAQGRAAHNGAKLGVSSVFLLNAPINTSKEWRPVEPIVITPGYSFTVVGQSVNTDVSMSAEW